MSHEQQITSFQAQICELWEFQTFIGNWKAT